MRSNGVDRPLCRRAQAMVDQREAAMVKDRRVLATAMERKLPADASGRAYAEARGTCGGRLCGLVHNACCVTVYQSIPP